MAGLKIGIGLLSLLQVLLLMCLYQPLPEMLDKPWFDAIYNVVFAASSILLVLLAYRAFVQHRALLGLLAAVLAFPGLMFWATILTSLLANRSAE
ncbi:Na+/melibiose symporter-like transporter [Hymenobacter sp. UYAg731]